MKTVLFVALIAGLVSSSLAALAVDTATLLTSTQWQCLAGQGNEISITRVYDPAGAVDMNGITNLKNAYNGATEDGYNVIFSPCLANCQNNITDPGMQVQAAINALNQQFEDVFIWVAVDATQPWSTNQQTNQQFLMGAVNAVFNTNGGAGVLSNYNAWTKLFGASFTQASQSAQYLLWVNWNGKQDLTTGWTPFGGWTAPFAHQYAGGITNNNCTSGAAINLSYWNDQGFAKLKKLPKMHKANPKFKPVA